MLLMWLCYRTLIRFYLEYTFNQLNFTIVFQDVHVARSTIFRIDCKVQIIRTRAATKRNASRFLIFKMTNKIAGRCSCHSRFLGGIESFQNQRVFNSIGKCDINRRNFPKWSSLLNFNQGQSCIKGKYEAGTPEVGGPGGHVPPKNLGF